MLLDEAIIQKGWPVVGPGQEHMCIGEWPRGSKKLISTQPNKVSGLKGGAYFKKGL